MPQLANSPMSIPISCPLYLDMSVTHHPEATNYSEHRNSRNMFDINYLYENLMKNQANMYQFNPNLFAESFNYYLNQNYRNGEKGVSPKSFSIESILGFSNSSSSSSSSSSSTSSKDLYSNQSIDFPESYRIKNQTVIGEEGNYRTVSAQVIGSSKTKDQLLDKQFIGNRREVLSNDDANMKPYHTLNRKSNKAFKASVKVKNGGGGGGNQSKSKRVRTIFTPEQLERLETEFERQQYMVGTGRNYLASTLNLTEAQVKVWFQNRRIKWRKQHLEGQDQLNEP